jgi:tripartite-type tricarboxylate transporter receptor subunit TctC
VRQLQEAKMKRDLLRVLLLVGVFFNGVTVIHSEAAYPDKPIVWIVHYSPGGGFDMVSRAIARQLQKDLGVPVVVKNVTGAGGRTGATLLYRAKPNGYTVGLMDARALTISQLLYKPSYDMEKFEWIGVINSDHTFVFVPKGSPFKSMDDVRKATKPVRFTVTTPATVPAAIYVPEALNFPARLVAGYGGASEAIPAIMRGDGDATTGWSYTAAQSFLRTGDIVAILVNDREPDPRMPNVPSLADFGIADLADGLVFYRALATPPGTPKPIRDALSAAVQKALAAPETVEFFKKIGAPMNSQFGAKEVQKTIARVVTVHKKHLASLKQAIGQ